MNLEGYIKDLAPELQEKARACGSVEELLALAKEAKISVPDEMLAAIAGGDQPDPENCKPVKCPKCGSKDVGPDMGEEGESFWVEYYKCYKCGYIFNTY